MPHKFQARNFLFLFLSLLNCSLSILLWVFVILSEICGGGGGDSSWCR